LKPFTTITVAFLGLIAILQLLRLIFGWEVRLNGAVVPVWLSGIAFVIAGGLAVMVWREHHR
jgi:high-affinity Fe2+/Pb2+ permease